MTKQQVFLQAAYFQGLKLACANAGLSPEEFEKQAGKVWEGVKAFGRRFMPQASRDKSFLKRVDAVIAKGKGGELPEEVMNRYTDILSKPSGKAGKAVASPSAYTSGPYIMGAPAPANALSGSAARQQGYRDQLKNIMNKVEQTSNYRKSLGEAHKKIKTPGIGATALGGALVGGGIGALSSDEGQGSRGFLRGAMIGGGVGAGAGMMGKNLLSAPGKFKAMTEAAKASGQGPEALKRIEQAKALYKQKALTRHSGKALLGAGLGGTAGYLGANALLGSGHSPESSNQVPIGVGYDQPLYGNLPYGNGNPQMGWRA